MSQSPISPTYSSGADLQRTTARHVRPSMSRRNSNSADCTQVAYVPLPLDVDRAFTFIVRTLPEPGAVVQTDVGIRLQNCLVADFVRAPVEHTDVKIDAAKMFPGGKVVVQRGYFPEESVPPPLEVSVETEDGSGFTWGHLLSLIVREQLQAVTQSEEPLEAGDNGSWENGMLRYEHVWVVAIRRSDGADGPVRYFPELEVRMPFN